MRPDALSRGTNQSAGRLYNERLVLSLIRRHGSLPKAEIARQTGLSPQTITLIMRQLEADELVLRRDRQRGRVGQPSVPYALNPDSVLSLGLKIGRRSSDLILIDLLGQRRGAVHLSYAYPTPDGILRFVEAGIDQVLNGLPGREIERITGLGIAAPFELWNWAEYIGVSRQSMEAWHGFDTRAEVENICGFPVLLMNDATAACAAELTLGNKNDYRDWLYLFIGFFIGGGVALSGSLFPGRTGYAGAMGPMPFDKDPDSNSWKPLMLGASLCTLETRLTESGLDPSILSDEPADWRHLGAPLDLWIEEAATNLAFAIVTATAVIDFEAIVVDGGLPPDVRSRIVERIRNGVTGFDRRGLPPIEIVEGSIGSAAREIGGACLPLLANYSRDREVLFKETI